MRTLRRNYPGFWAVLFIVLLRTAIGWHFLYEGITKVYSTPEGRESFLAKLLPPHAPLSQTEQAFSAEGYLRASTGPLSPRFRGLIPDVDGLERLDPAKLEKSWKNELERYTAHYKWDESTRAKAAAELDHREAEAATWFRDPENDDRIRKYKRNLERVDDVLANKSSLKFQRERAYKDRQDLEADRRALLGVIDGWTTSLRESWRKLAGNERAAPPPALMTRLDWINMLTMGGLIAVGCCLLLGLFTRQAALGATAYLTLFYLSMPPWPGVPEPRQVEGHYLFVNKNLVELIACLVLAATPNGLWIGLDALLFGARARRKEAASLARSSAVQPAQAAASVATHVEIARGETNPKRLGPKSPQ